MAEKEQGELAVSVSGGWVRIVEADNGAAFAPIHLKIDYELVVGGEAVEGIVFRRPGDAGDENVSRQLTDLTCSKHLTCFSHQLHSTQPGAGFRALIVCGRGAPGNWKLLYLATWRRPHPQISRKIDPQCRS